MNRDGNRLCLNFDPRTKILLLIELDIILFMGHSLIYETCVLLFCSLILAIGGQRKSAAKFLTVYMVFVVMQWFVDPYVEIFIFSLLHFITVCDSNSNENAGHRPKYETDGNFPRKDNGIFICTAFHFRIKCK